MKSAFSWQMIFFVLFTALISCNKVVLTNNTRISFSADTLRFDTVFTTVGSVTQSLKVYNNSNEPITFSTIKLMGGPSAPFKININGLATNEATNITLAANDSLYIFVSVTIQPNNVTLPFLLTDSIQFSENNHQQFIQLQAYGQNAHFINQGIITSDTIWNNDLPYVILGSLYIKEQTTLTLNAGCKIFVHGTAPIIIDGTLICNGLKNNEVVFCGDRLDNYYNQLPGSWPGISFQTKSLNNLLKFVLIKNAYQGISVFDPSMNNQTKLTLHQCIVDNAQETGIYALNSSIKADNCLISNCKKNIKIEGGGDYEWVNCTDVAYSNSLIPHQNPVLETSNVIYHNGQSTINNLNASFINCIFWGDNSNGPDEINIIKEGSGIFNVTFENSLYRSVADPPSVNLINVIKNQDPLFDSIDIAHQYYNFRITNNTQAPGIDQGIITGFSKDLDDHPRIINGHTDLGCYEKN